MNEITHTIALETDEFPTIFCIQENPAAPPAAPNGHKHAETYKKFLHQNLRCRQLYLNSLIKDTLKIIVAAKVQNGVVPVNKNQCQSPSNVEVKNDLGLNLTDELFRLLREQSSDLEELSRVLEV